MYIIDFIPLNSIFNRSKVFFDFSECETILDKIDQEEKIVLANCISKYSQAEWNVLLDDKVHIQCLDKNTYYGKLQDSNKDFLVLKLNALLHLVGYREKDRFRIVFLGHL